jgi:hypothetical protein
MRTCEKYESVPLVGDVRIDYRYLREGVNFAKRKGIMRLRVVPPFYGSSESDSQTLDLAPLWGQQWVTSVDVAFHLASLGTKLKIENIEALYSLGTTLTELAVGCFNVDLNRFPNLGKLFVSGARPVVLGGAPLTSLSYMGSRESDCRFVRGVSSLRSICLQTTKTKTLAGLESLTELECLKLMAAPNLLDASALESCPILRTIHVEACKRLDQSFLSHLKAVKKLFIDKVDSLEFVKELPYLEDLSFWNCLDGDLSPVLESKSLRNSWFSVDRRHYSHKRKDFKRHFEERQAALK